MSDVTRLLHAIEQGDAQASQDLLPLVYEELRQLARARMADERAGHTLQPTALVHEAYLRLVGNDGDEGPRWENRGHFFAAAAEAMRRILIENARRKRSGKHGGQRERVELNEADLATTSPDDRLLAIDDALNRLADEDPPAAELVKLRFFAGFSISEAAEILGLSRSTAYAQWAYARAWLQCRVEAAD
jgi:RNA polymerase sigma factor (TIGR02999 family)